MKPLILAASLLALCSSAMATDVGVSISVGEPGFYGRIDLGNYPQPQVLYREPVIVQRPPRYVETAPIYLRVPPGHAKHWDKHCREYNACGQRVLFVDDNWYEREYAPRYRAEHGDRGRDYRDDRRDDRRDDDRGPGRGKGHGNGHGNGHGHGRDD
ncbi:MAG TPA: hypothetical protein VJ752_14690 [Burkholderiaceae bacterium]|nr:hypothetical protein [Burkholderiaceae bacterium]